MNSLRIAQALGIGASAWLAGSIASISLITVPALQQSRKEDGVTATTIVRQWKNVFNYGKSMAPPFAATAAAAFFYAAWTSRNLVFIGCAVLTVGIVPFTIVAMSATNNRLLGHAALSEAQLKMPSAARLSEQEADGLIQKWKTLNLTRSLLPLVGCTIALATL